MESVENKAHGGSGSAIKRAHEIDISDEDVNIATRIKVTDTEGTKTTTSNKQKQVDKLSMNLRTKSTEELTVAGNVNQVKRRQSLTSVANEKIKMLIDENTELKNNIKSMMAELVEIKKTNNQQKVVEPVQKQQNILQTIQQPITTQNRFSGLEIGNVDITDDNMENEDDDTSFEMVKKAVKHKNKTLTITNRSTVLKQQVQTTKHTQNIDINVNTINKNNIRPPPIHIHNQQINDTIKIIKGLNIDNFHIKRINNNKHTLQMGSLENYKEAKNILDEVSAHYFTYTPKEEKPKTIVLKGLHENEDSEEIKTLIQQHNIKVTHITQLKTKQSENTDRKLPLYIVQCAPDTNMGLIYNIKTLNYQTVTWEPLKKKDMIMQCHQCQRFGHAAANCNLQYRCVKCDQKHEPGHCAINTKINKEEVYCTNCNMKGHPASYKGCPIYQATLNRLKERISEKRAKKPESIPIHNKTYVSQENGTFAEMLKGGGRSTMTSSRETTNENTIMIQHLTSKLDKMAEVVSQQGEQISTLLALIQQLVK